MTLFLWILLASAAISIGLRVSSFFVPKRTHAGIQLVVALVTGVAIAAAILEVSSSYRVFDFGLGLLISLSPIGPYDLARWWFGRNKT